MDVSRLVLLCFVFIGHTLVSQAQRLEVDAPDVVQFDYDPFSGLPGSQSFTVDISNLAVEEVDTDDETTDRQNDGETDDGIDIEEPEVDQPQQVILTIRTIDAVGLELIGETMQLPMSLSAGTEPSIMPIDQGVAGLVTLDPTQSLAASIDLDVLVAESVFADAGQYSLNMEVALLDVETNELIGVAQPLTIDVFVLPKLQTNIAGTKGRYEDGSNFAVIDFGELQTGEQQQVFIQVRGNTLASIEIRSENEGKMVNTENAKFSVDYRVDVDGELSTLESPLTLSRSVAKSLQGSAFPMTVKIGNVSNSFAGTYQDIISVDVTPQ